MAFHRPCSICMVRSEYYDQKNTGSGPVCSNIFKLFLPHLIHDCTFLLSNCRIIYRDLKPQNIGFDYTGNVKLFDFGLAKKLTLKNLVENNYNLTGLTGSMRYMSPEVFNEKPYNLSADTYSFGILFWYICSLSVPFLGYSMEMMLSDVANGFTRPEINRSWPKECTNIMENSWKANPDLRPTMSNINADLSAALKYYTKRYG